MITKRERKKDYEMMDMKKEKKRCRSEKIMIDYYFQSMYRACLQNEISRFRKLLKLN